MEEEAVATMRYWCHMCSQTVNPVMEAEIKCPFCQSGFIEEMQQQEEEEEEDEHRPNNNSLWAPILMELINDQHPVRRRRTTSHNHNLHQQSDHPNQPDLDLQLQEILRRRRRHSAAVLQLLQGIRAGLVVESGGDNNNAEQRVILVNPFNQTVTVQNSGDDNNQTVGSLGDYFIGPGFEALLQRLAENDPNRYGTPPATKEAIEGLANVKIEEAIQCSVCLDDFEVGTEAKEMPCSHKFHGDCLLPWLELHSSCPVCRFQLPADETKTDTVPATANDSNASGTVSNETENSDENRHEEEEEEEEEEENDNGGGFTIPWPFSSLFSMPDDDNNPSTGTN